MSLGDWRLWWHSHGTISTNPSGQDQKTLLLFAQELHRSGGEPWALGLVTNSRNEYTGWLAIDYPFSLNITGIDVEIYEDADEELVKKVDDMLKGVKAKVSVFQPETSRLPVKKDNGQGTLPDLDKLPLSRRERRRIKRLHEQLIGVDIPKNVDDWDGADWDNFTKLYGGFNTP